MNRFSFSSLRVRLTVLMLLAVVPALVLTLYTGLEHHQCVLKDAEEDAFRLVRFASGVQEQLIASAGQVLTSLSKLPEVRHGDKLVAQTTLSAVLEQSPQFINIGVASRNGELICSALPARNPTELCAESFFQFALQRRTLTVGEYDVSMTGQKPMLSLGYPIFGEDGQVSGVVFASLDLTWLDQLISEAKLPKGSTLTMIDRAGTVLARYPDGEKWMGKNVAESGLFKALTSQGIQGSMEARGLTGKMNLFAYSILRGVPSNRDAYLCLGIPTDRAFAEDNRILARNLAALGLVAVVMLYATWVGTYRFILSGINVLLQATKRLARGDLSARTSLGQGHGELDQLGASFDEMAKALESHEASRRQVEEALRESKRTLSTLLSNLPGMAYRCRNDRDRTMEFVSEGCAGLLGKQVDDLLGNAQTAYGDMIHPADREEVHREIQAALDENRPYRTFYRVRTATNAVKWAWEQGRGVVSTDGRVVGLEGLVTDITERKTAEEAVRESEERFRSLSACSPVGVFLMDISGKCNYANPRCRGIFGRTLMEILEDGWTKSIHPDDRNQLLEEWATCARGGREYTREARVLTGSNSVRWVHLRSSPMVTDEAERVGHVMTVEDITYHKRALEALSESEERFRGLVETARDVIFTVSPEGVITMLNPAFEDVTGLKRQEWIGQVFAPLLHPDDLPVALDTFQRVLSGEEVSALEFRVRHAAGRYLVGDFTLTRQIHDGKTVGMLGIARDITERRQLEDQLRQSQKMEAIGQLAGGVAHDFNNILTAIIGYSEISLRRINDQDPVYKNIDEVLKAAHRASSLTRQLLAFSRRQTLNPCVLDLNLVINDMNRMLHRLLGEDVELTTELDQELGAVKADEGQIEQVIMNLAVNARDAMSPGGQLTIRTANLSVMPEQSDRPAELAPGEYVVLTITDDGSGMSDEVKAHLFEPFFTTKERGKGTGLGLATCYGIVKQSGGHIVANSEIGKGTTFTIYLPLVEEEPDLSPADDTPDELPRGNETVLVAEDEQVVRDLTCEVLSQLGYRVMKAASGSEAIGLASKTKVRDIQLLVTDVVMPQMNGKELAERLRQMNPAVKIIFTSGYTDDAIVDHGVLNKGIAFLQKPFTGAALARKVREELDKANGHHFAA